MLWLNPEAVLPTRSHRTFGDKIVKKSSAARSCLQKVSRQIAHGILLPLLPLMKARYGIKGGLPWQRQGYTADKAEIATYIDDRES